MYPLYPAVKELKFQEGVFLRKDTYAVFFQTEMVNVFNRLNEFLSSTSSKTQDADILFLLKDCLSEQAYELCIDQKRIVVYYKTIESAYYAATTLKQIFFHTEKEIKSLSIVDEPDLKRRGFMLDISRNKVPTIDTIKKVIDMMSDLKMNHFELYVEGFSFEYASHRQFLIEDGYITVEEYQEIEAYANARAIDFVPNQNGFGHMAKWLETNQYKDLAEVPEGIFLWGRQRPPGTLNPLDERSLTLIKSMYQDMLPHTNSRYFNMNFDEPFELGKGKSKEACEKEGLGNVYIDYALKAYDEIKKYDKIPLMWGDVLIKHPELLHRLPKDLIFVDWGYDGAYPFSRNLKKLQDAKIQFMAAPGTTSWCSFLGRTQDWIENITNACIYTKAYGGEGVLLTDWGDFGHLQFIPVSYPALVFHGLMTWRTQEGTYFTLKHYLNQVVFKDHTAMIADILLDLGNYNRYENRFTSNGTLTFYSFMWMVIAIRDYKENPIRAFLERAKTNIPSFARFQSMKKFLNQKIEDIQMTNMQLSDAQVIKEELLHSIHFVKTIAKVMVSFSTDVDSKRKLRYLEEAIDSKDRLLNGLKHLWLTRNKSGGLQDTLSIVEDFIRFAEEAKKEVIRRGEENVTE